MRVSYCCFSFTVFFRIFSDTLEECNYLTGGIGKGEGSGIGKGALGVLKDTLEHPDLAADPAHNQI